MFKFAVIILLANIVSVGSTIAQTARAVNEDGLVVNTEKILEDLEEGCLENRRNTCERKHPGGLNPAKGFEFTMCIQSGEADCRTIVDNKRTKLKLEEMFDRTNEFINSGD